MRALRAALALLLLGALHAFPQDRAPRNTCGRDPRRYYDKAAGRCCYQCPAGLSPLQSCPQDSTHCGKHCEPDHFLDVSGRCTACVSCTRDDLVETRPCSRNSTRICECRPGMFCATSATNSCARCLSHSICPAGKIVKLQGTAQRDTICELPPKRTPDCSSNPEDCRASASTSIPQATSTLTSPATFRTRTMLPGEDTTLTSEDASESVRAPSSPSSVEEPSPGPGLSPQSCLQGSADCRKRCEPDYYLDAAGRCTACVSCSRDDLVEKRPCTWNSSRVCECRPGMYCATSATNSCARCLNYTICPSGMMVKPPRDARLLGTSSKTLPIPQVQLRGTPPMSQGRPGLTAAPALRTARRLPAAPPQSLKGPPRPATGIERAGMPPSQRALPSLSSTGKPLLDPGPVFLLVVVVLLLVAGSASFLLCHWRACRKGIRQKLHLCYTAQTFQPTLELVDSRPRRSPTIRRSVLVAEPDTEELGLMSTAAVETCTSAGTACPESLRLLEASPDGVPEPPRDLPDPRVTAEHTNNKIEKIYIMKADTVIVGTVKTEVAEGRGLVVPVGPEFEEELEVDHVPGYPEQETEPPLGSSGDVMFSVEEEGKEDPLPTTVSGK